MSDPTLTQTGKLNASFYFTELLIFLSQVIVIFLVAFFTTDLLRNETRLEEFANAKINNSTMSEIGLTLLAITLWLGVLTIIKEFADSSFLSKLSGEILNELPRTIYFFGSSITAAILAIAVYTMNHPASHAKPASGYFLLAAWLALVAFIYGCGLKALLTVKARKKNTLHAKQHET